MKPAAPNTIEITLDHPVFIGGVTYRSLTIRPPTRADEFIAMRLGASKFARGGALIAIVCGVPRKVIRALAPSDLDQIESFLVPHMGG